MRQNASTKAFIGYFYVGHIRILLISAPSARRIPAINKLSGLKWINGIFIWGFLVISSKWKQSVSVYTNISEPFLSLRPFEIGQF